MIPVGLGLALVFAAATPRYTTIFQATLDGKAQPSSAAELRLIRELSKSGIRFIDEAQSRRIRSVTDAGTLISGTVPEVVTTLDADIIVAAIAKTARLESEFLGKGAARYDTAIEAKVIAVDTGEVLGAFSVREGGMDFQASKAADASAEGAAARLAKEILEHVPRELQPETIALTIAGIPNLTRQNAVEAALRAVPGIKTISVVQAGRGATKLELTLERAGTRELAAAIEDAPDTGISVTGYSARALHAEYSPARALRFSLLVSPFKGGSEGRAIASVLESALSDAAALTAAKAPPERTLVLEGVYRREKSALFIDAKILAAPTRAPITSAQTTCKEDGLSACVAALGAKLASSLAPQLEEKRHALIQRSGEIAAALPSDRTRPLAITELVVEDIYPALFLRYATQGLGRAVLKNEGKVPLNNVSISVDVPGLTRGKSERRLAPLAPGASAGVELSVALDKDLLLREQAGRPVIVRVEASASAGELRVAAQRSVAAIARGRNALTWRAPESIAAFVTHTDGQLVAWARHAYGAIPAAEKERLLAAPIALFASMAKMKYAPDPARPFAGDGLDYISFPIETAGAGGGDCDDLSVFYAALAEAVNVQAILVTTPGHIFVAVDSGLPARNRALLTFDPDRSITHHGRAFVPLETTKVGAGFEAAWNEAASQLRALRARGEQPGIIDVRAAWASWPATELADPPPGRLALYGSEAIGRETARVLRALESARQNEPDPHQRGLWLASLGRIAEAKAAFESALAAKPKDAVLLNNLGNVEVIGGRAKEALVRYDAALVLMPKSSEVHVNAAIAAWLAGDETKFGEHIASCLANGGESFVRELGEHGLGDNNNRGSENGRSFHNDLERLLYKTEPAAPKTRASEAGADPSLQRWLYWL